MTLSGEEYINQMKADIAAKHANLDHPFCQLLVAGKLTKPQLQGWAKQRFKGISGMDLGQVAQLYVKAPDDQIRRHVLFFQASRRRKRLSQRQESQRNVFGFLPSHRTN